ncbi:MAG TPA: sulfite exporter TauE/SafE family protein [Burkholderiales bacterium]|nr:sulfite exporter TauE/SafE family protein [Burkholderiales bacterium]
MIGAGEIAALAAIAFLGALLFGITGFGAALITIPLATHFVPLPFALALFALGDLAMALSVGLENPRNAVRSEWTRLVPMILAGTALGVTLLVNLPRQAGLLLLGLFVFSYALYSLFGGMRAGIIAAGWAWVAGLAGGITSAVFGAGGPPYAIYLSHRGLTKEQFRATMGFATMTSISLRVAAFLITGLLLQMEVWKAALAVVPAAFAGILIARRAFIRISREALMKAVGLMLLVSGASLVLRALA